MLYGQARMLQSGGQFRRAQIVVKDIYCLAGVFLLILILGVVLPGLQGCPHLGKQFFLVVV